jgi:predicted glycosyltransferase involved in capsule biosynthesis
MNTEKTDLTDVTFMIPVRMDAVVRLENLLMAIESLLCCFDCKIYVLEASSFNNGFIEKLIDKDVKYTFVEDKDPVFYRTRYLNIMARTVDTDILAIWDADVIIPAGQIVEAVNKIRAMETDFCFPYDGRFLDTSRIIREYFFQKRNIDILTDNASKMKLIYGDKSPGGAVLGRTKDYRKAGMENENFYGWGPEDYERVARWKGLGYRIDRVQGQLFHLTHSRGINSTYRSPEQAVNTSSELLTTRMSSEQELSTTFS